ncbi:MAG: hypothetical protein PVJ39_14755 [Gammaproteobacteria bacterium]|jgi:TPR repeat protein
MQCSIFKRTVWLVVAAASCAVAQADFNDATRAYLLGDFEKARYEALVAATDGDPAAQMLLGQLYFKGEGVEKDIATALYWYEKAASQGFGEAQYRLGSLYFTGKDNIPKDYNKAYQWLSQAAENGKPEAKPKLEGLFKMESGKVVNLHESLEVLQQVAATGNRQARYLLAEKLLDGIGLEKNTAKAVEMLTDDAKHGFVKAQKRLGELYYYGKGVPQDYYEAYAWSMAYAGTKELGGLIREGKQIARSALRKLDGSKHEQAYIKSQQYFEQFVLPFHKNAREVGPSDYRIVVRSRKEQLKQARERAKKLARQKRQTSRASEVKDNTAQQNKSAGHAVDKEKAPQDKDAQEKDAQEKDAQDKTIKDKQARPEPEQAPDAADKRNKNGLPASTVTNKTTPEATTAHGKSTATPTATITADAAVTGARSSSDQEAAPGKPGPSGSNVAGQDATVATRDSKGEIKDDNGVGGVPTVSAGAAAGATVAGAVPTAPAGHSSDSATETPVKRRYRDVYNRLVRTKSRLQVMFKSSYEQGVARQGRIVFEMTISPAGKITDINVLSSELEAPLLEDELIEHLKTIDFGAKTNAEPFKISFPVDFQP